MRLSQADENVLSTLFGKEVVDKLSGALKSDDGELSLGARLNGKVYTQEEIENLTKANQDAYIEIGYKKLAKEADVDISGMAKDPKSIVDKLKSSITLGLEEKYKGQTPTDELNRANDKIAELEGKYGKLNETYEATQSKVSEWEEKYKELENENYQKDINSLISKSFPDKMKMDKSDALLITRNMFNFEKTDEGLIAKRDGKIVTDAVGDPEKIDNVVKAFVEEKKWVKGSGMGGDDRSSSGINKGMSAEQAEKYLTEKGIDPGSQEGLKQFIELQKK